MILLSATRQDKGRTFVVVVDDTAQAEEMVQRILEVTTGEETTYGVRFKDLASDKELPARLLRTWTEEAI